MSRDSSKIESFENAEITRSENREFQATEDDKNARQAVTGHTEAEMDAELQKLEQQYSADNRVRILSSTIFGNPKTFIWILASFASMGGILYGIDQSLISGAGVYGDWIYATWRSVWSSSGLSCE
ncbi:Inositol transporter 1 [Galdieria sulphuraria]|nr:Inositol transporter 1 [Galdieria sulphuraria]